MEKYNVCILLRQSLNKIISHRIVKHELFFQWFPFFCLFGNKLKKKKFKKKLNLSRNHATTRAKQKSCKEKILQLWDERKNRKIVLQRNEQQEKLEKNVKEKTSDHITFQTRLSSKECLLVHLEGLKNMSLWLHVTVFLLKYLQSCQLETLKKLANVSTICRKLFWCFSVQSRAFLFPNRTAQRKKVLVRFLEDIKSHCEEGERA